MTRELKKRGPLHFVLICFAGFFIAVAAATLFTIVILAVTDLFLFTRPPSVPFHVWCGRFFERIHWTFVAILWGITFFATLVALFSDSIKRWGRRKLDGEK